MTSRQIRLGLDLTYAPLTITSQKPTKRELDLLFEVMYDDYIGGQLSAAPRTYPAAPANQVLQTPTASTTTVDVDELPQQQHVQQQDNQAPLQPETVADNVPNAMSDGDVFENPFAPPSTSAAESSSSQYVDPSNMHRFYQPHQHDCQWTKDYPLEQVIGEPSRPVLTRNQLRTDGEMCIYALTVSTMEPRNVKEAITDTAWFDSMQEELLQFKEGYDDGSYQDIFGICCTQIVHCIPNGRENCFLAWFGKGRCVRVSPEGFIDADHPSHVYKLKKALYGIKQALRQLYEQLSSFSY
ncbi:retrovirus-related pol polyprotein from transposon TNT 1-94 [Tanacetum coccineum]